MVDPVALERSFGRFRLRLGALSVLGLTASAVVVATGQGAVLVVALLVVLVGRAAHAEIRRRRWMAQTVPVLRIRTSGLEVVGPGSQTRLDWEGIAAIHRTRWRGLDVVRIRMCPDLDRSDPRITTDLAGWRWWQARRQGIRLAAEVLAIAPSDLAVAVARLSGGRQQVG